METLTFVTDRAESAHALIDALSGFSIHLPRVRDDDRGLTVQIEVEEGDAATVLDGVSARLSGRSEPVWISLDGNTAAQSRARSAAGRPARAGVVSIPVGLREAS